MIKRDARNPFAEMLDRLSAMDWGDVLSSRAMLGVILLITGAAYIPSLRGWFLADDFFFLHSSSQQTPIGTYIVQAFDYRDRSPVPEFGFYRPLYVITFRLCYAVFGLNAFPYHALNLALHLGSIVLVWLIARRLLEDALAANVAAFLFALHPAYAETVTWIARGDTGMVTFVYLSTLLLFMKYLDGGRWSRALYVASVLGFTAAVLYHTTALSLAAVLPAYAFLVVRKPSAAFDPRAWLRFMPFAVVALGMVFVQTRPEVDVSAYGFKPGWHQYTYYGTYLGLSLFPVLPADWGDLNLGALVRIQQVASLVMIATTLVVLDRRRWPYTGVFIAWWLYISLGPDTMSIVQAPVIGAVPAQLYLPGAALALFFVAGVRATSEILPSAIVRPARRALPAILLVLAAAFVGLIIRHQQSAIPASLEDRAFTTQLRKSVPSLPPGGVLYVVNPPPSLVVFNESALDAAVQLYYGEVTVRVIPPGQVAAVTSSLRPGDKIFQFRPPRARR